jgi:Nucleotidyltransferase domain
MDLAAWRRDVRVGAGVPANALALMLYGSIARGDSNTDSDIDVLVLVPERPGSVVLGALSIVRYLPTQIEAMVSARGLFAWHLKTEGVYLEDDHDRLRSLLDAHRGPDPHATLVRVRELTPVLDVSKEQFHAAPGIARVAKYLLRTAIYAQAIASGYHSFEVNAASATIDKTGAIGEIMRRSAIGSSHDWATFLTVRKLLDDLVGGLRENEFGSLDALVVRTSGLNASLSALALHALTNLTDEMAYAASGMPVL